MTDHPDNPVSGLSAPKPSSWQQRLPRPSVEFPRKYLPPSLNLSDWHALEPYLQELKDRRIPDLPALLLWIGDYGEFKNAVDEEGTRLYIDMTCDTRDAAKEKDYLYFVEEVEPRLAPEYDALNRKLVGHGESRRLPADRFGRWRESLETSIRLYHPKNVPLQARIAKLSQEYQKICGEMTVEWDGEIKTLGQLAPYLQSPDRAVRERAWTAGATRRLRDRDRLDELFDELLALRQEMAGNLGLKSYTEYAFLSHLRTDYGPEDCLRFHEAVEAEAVPCLRRLQESRRRRLGVDKLRPWDLNCDPEGRPPLRPFQGAGELIDGVGRIFRRLDPELAGHFEQMRNLGLMDLENRPGKAPGGYQSGLSEMRLPFIFMNAVGLNEDVFTILHESGHAFHLLYARAYDLDFNRHAPTEFSEVASMSMERLGAAFLEEFYDEPGRKRALAAADEDVVRLFPWVATIDAFQFRLYDGPHGRRDRERFWLELDRRLGPDLDWSGLEEFRSHSWQKQLHLYEVPFYYIEYGIAQLGALQVWQRSLEDRQAALSDYKAALKLGGTLGLRELFGAAGIRFDMGREALARSMAAIWRNWEDSQAKGA